MTTHSSSWYITKTQSGQCDILTQTQLEYQATREKSETWGPFNTQSEAIAKRVGLIRSGKCKPA
jgi:hypothetical protein